MGIVGSLVNSVLNLIASFIIICATYESTPILPEISEVVHSSIELMLESPALIRVSLTPLANCNK